MRVPRNWGAVVALVAIVAEVMRRLSQIKVRPRLQHSVHPPVTATPYGCPLPAVIHRRVDKAKPGRLIIVGDCHGTPELFRLLESIKYNTAYDNLVLCGDLVNKGPVSLAVLDAVPKLNCWAVRGNHDDAVLGAWLRFRSGQPMNPKFEWAAAMGDEQAAVLRDLPFTVSLPEYGISVVHAGLLPDTPLEQQDLWSMYKMRNVVSEPIVEAGLAGQAAEQPATQGCVRLRPVEKAKEGGEPWAALWHGPPHVFFGHDARRDLQLHSHATGLDTGCVYGGRLTAAVVPPLDELHARSPGFVAAMRAGRGVSREDLCLTFVEVPAAKVYAPPSGPQPGAATANSAPAPAPTAVGTAQS